MVTYLNDQDAGRAVKSKFCLGLPTLYKLSYEISQYLI